MDRIYDGLCRLLGLLMVVGLALMVVMVFGNVVLRYGFSSGIAVSEELSRWLFVWLTFLGAIVAVRRRTHLGTDLLVANLPPLGRRLCFAASRLLMLYMCWLMGRGAWQQTLINLETTSAALQASQAWLFASGLLFAVLAGLFLLHELWKLFTGRLDDAALVGPSAPEETAHAPAGGRRGPETPR